MNRRNTHPAIRLARRGLALSLAIGLVAGCNSDDPDEATQEVHLKYSWVVMGAGNTAIARVATDYHRGNVNIATMPYKRRRGMRPALEEPDVEDIVAFLRTLTDAQFSGGRWQGLRGGPKKHAENGNPVASVRRLS